ncbi:MAG: ABC transporter permease [Candidatus Brocadiaceae bacterium]|nr:ABC transporter permease [Candidatus Brocadiaceae bacterium]
MTLWGLVVREARFRLGGFCIGLVSVVAAIACLTGAVTLLHAHDIRSDRVLIEREKATREEMARMEDDYRLIMRDLGHNVLIIHRDQDLAALVAAGYPEVTMPEEYVHRLADRGIATLNHLLPVLQKRTVWPEHGVEILLSGTPGQTPNRAKKGFLTADGTAYRDPIVATIPHGAVRLGNGVARRLGLHEGDRVVLMGEEFVVDRVLPGEGNVDDIAVWCSLEKVQQWLGLEGRINGILGLECICEVDRLGEVAREVGAILPDVTVLEFSSRVRARAQARGRAGEAHRTAIAAEMEHQRRMRRERELFAAVLVPVALTAAGLWVFFLVLGNVRERRTEIGVLRALGVRQATIMGVFLLKAVAMGALGAVLGYVVGVVGGALWGGVGPTTADFFGSFRLRLFLAAVLVAPALCAAAAWLPAMRAARQDPAEVLRDR